MHDGHCVPVGWYSSLVSTHLLWMRSCEIQDSLSVAILLAALLISHEIWHLTLLVSSLAMRKGDILLVSCSKGLFLTNWGWPHISQLPVDGGCHVCMERSSVYVFNESLHTIHFLLAARKKLNPFYMPQHGGNLRWKQCCKSRPAHKPLFLGHGTLHATIGNPILAHKSIIS